VNLIHHIKNISKFGVAAVVAVNRLEYKKVIMLRVL
jgi:formyltetrahydrofolate synthetase